MQELDDHALLREYADHDSEAAFATLVARHVNKVYSVALRHTRDPLRAEEITQTVFVILARKSGQLGRRVILSGWLYQTARLTALTAIRADIRRTRREQAAHEQSLMNEPEAEVWPQIAPLLDAAMAELNETDRHAVVLRFFDGKSLKDVGAALGGSEGAATLRLHRAVEKLRRFLTRRGVVVPAVVLTAAITANSVQAAPALVAKSVTAVAFAKGATASVSTLALMQGTIKAMASGKTLVAGVILAGAIFSQGTVASHFDLAGHANARMDRGTYLILSLLVAVGLPAFIAGGGYILRFLPAGGLNIPHRDYWLAPGRRDETYDYLFHRFFQLACAEAVFQVALQCLVVSANHQTPPHLAMPWLWLLTGCFAAIIAVWLGSLILHFGRITTPGAKN